MSLSVNVPVLSITEGLVVGVVEGFVGFVDGFVGVIDEFVVELLDGLVDGVVGFVLEFGIVQIPLVLSV
jgi:hypothetical protein